MSPETKQFVRKYADMVVRINQLLREKGWTQANLAEKMGKKPSEISRWLSGDHNLTLRSISKLEVELEGDIISIPQPVRFDSLGSGSVFRTVYRHNPVSNTKFNSDVGVQFRTPELMPLAS
ncbi:MAG: multiprotein-bridging factor 1 family protein [Bacteroidia bacterium]